MRLAVLTLLLAGGTAVPTVDTVVKDVLHAVEKALEFFSDDYSAINVDGLFGLRLGQGQLREAIRECEIRSCDANIYNAIVKLDTELDKAANAALPYVESEDPHYYERFLATIDKPYILPYEPTNFEDTAVSVGSNSHYNEEKGDTCYARMLGTYVENGKTLPRCNITSDCWDYMSIDDTSDYFITHQLLYFIMVEHVGCKDSVESFANGHKIRDLQRTFCNKIYEESKRLSERGNVRQHRKDLFLEQRTRGRYIMVSDICQNGLSPCQLNNQSWHKSTTIRNCSYAVYIHFQPVLCGPLGFEDFMRPDWIKMVLSWPDKRLGCFQLNAYKSVTELVEEIHSEDKQGGRNKDPEKTKKGPADINMSSGNNMRKLLREKQMKEGCLSHTSGLGFGVLCTYLRFIVRYSPMYML